MSAHRVAVVQQSVGQGRSQRDIVGALNGDGSFTFLDGSLKGVDLAEIAGVIEKISNGVQGMSVACRA